MNIEEISKRIYKFQEKRIADLGAELTPELVFIHLSEEIGEIARQLVNRNLPIRKYDEENLREEITQGLLDLLVLSRIFNIDLPKAITTKMDKMASSSKWTRKKAYG
jgi:NTP pyrophosphatase (non-canonical NTP hydrolase)